MTTDHDTAQSVYLELQQRFPGIASLQPLAIGTYDTLVERCPDIPADAIKKALQVHCRRLAYLERMAKPDSQRHTLEGEPVEPVSDENRAHAKAEYKRRKKRQGERAAARRAQEAAIRAKAQQTPPPESAATALKTVGKGGRPILSLRRGAA